MAGCVLRVSGAFAGAKLPQEFRSLDIEVRRHGNGGVVLSDSDDLQVQCIEAEAFLRENSAHLLSLGQNPLVEGFTLDFGLWQKDVAAQLVTFPASLVSAAGSLGMELCASLYLCSDDDDV